MLKVIEPQNIPTRGKPNAEGLRCSQDVPPGQGRRITERHYPKGRAPFLRLVPSPIFALAIAALCFCPSGWAANQAPLTSEEILKKIKYPSEFEATVFASPPNISYPIFISAAPDGTLF